MDSKQHKWVSPNIEKEVIINVYGNNNARPFLVFPTEGGNHLEWEESGMIRLCKDYISNNKIQIYAVDSIFNNPWNNNELDIETKISLHRKFELYIMEEVLPFIEKSNTSGKKAIIAGADLGGFNATNIFFKRPDMFDTLISLSGMLKLSRYIGEFINDDVYYNSPLLYVPNINDESVIKALRDSKIIFCAGQGEWGDEMLRDLKTMNFILWKKKIPCWVDIWGNDVNHDWSWWRLQLAYFLSKIEDEL